MGEDHKYCTSKETVRLEFYIMQCEYFQIHWNICFLYLMNN